MTQDDTFRILTRIPIERMRGIIYDNISVLKTLEDAEALLIKYGWTVKSYDRAHGIGVDD